MPVRLEANSYGKSRVRVVKLTRLPDRHDLADLNVDVRLEGDFDAVHLQGDNRNILTTDAMKNTVNVLAKTWSGENIEEFATQLIDHILADNPQVASVRIEIAQNNWIRRGPYNFVRGSEEKRTTTVHGKRGSVSISSGIENMVALRSAGSAFVGYKRERYTTLKETDDRIMASAIRADWKYSRTGIPYTSCWEKAREAMLEAFSGPFSPSVQQTAYAMGEAALNAVSEIASIRLVMPNKHCLLVDFAPFGLENANEIFTPTDEPHGTIEVSVGRSN